MIATCHSAKHGCEASVKICGKHREAYSIVFVQRALLLLSIGHSTPSRSPRARPRPHVRKWFGSRWLRYGCLGGLGTDHSTAEKCKLLCPLGLEPATIKQGIVRWCNALRAWCVLIAPGAPGVAWWIYVHCLVRLVWPHVLASLVCWADLLLCPCAW